MLENIKKTVRYLERQHKSKTALAGVGAGSALAMGGLILTGAVAAPLAPLALVPVMISRMFLPLDARTLRTNDWTVNDFKLVGDGADLSKIVAMQEYIDNKTKNFKHLGRLPEKLEAHLQRHIADVAPVLQRVRVYHAYAWGDKEKGELSSFEFHRKFIDEKGKTAAQTMAKVELVPMGLLPRSEPARLIVEQHAKPMQSLPAPDVLTGEFKALADKVEGVAERVGALEQPAPAASLEKPKFRANGRN